MKNIKKFICLLIVTVLITPSIAIAEDTYSGYFNNEEITMFADTSVKISENEKSAVVICTPKVRHFWRCIFLWQRKGKNIENTRQNSNYLL